MEGTSKAGVQLLWCRSFWHELNENYTTSLPILGSSVAISFHSIRQTGFIVDGATVKCCFPNSSFVRQTFRYLSFYFFSFSICFFSFSLSTLLPSVLYLICYFHYHFFYFISPFPAFFFSTRYSRSALFVFCFLSFHFIFFLFYFLPFTISFYYFCRFYFICSSRAVFLSLLLHFSIFTLFSFLSLLIFSWMRSHVT